MLAEEIRKLDLKVCFFNATAQGGGVALMRHALIRLLRLLKISVSWHVPKPNPHVFRITKDNHNLLQGVAKKDVEFTEECKRDWSHWVDLNCERYWVDGPFQWANVIVLDDPQVSPYVEHIKEVNPDCNIIYRSHIEIRSDLVNNPETKQHKLWKYINGFVEKTDLFISHPIRSFIPSDIPDEKVLLMPACTDPLDGLNKNMTEEDNIFWLFHFNKISFEQCGNQLAYPDRPFIAQIARFDPSKGIPDVLDAYLLFRKRMAESGVPLEKIPQLCICGHGSVDDPDATSVFNETFNTVNTPEFDEIRSDICICRVPPEDRILNAIISSAHVMLQLSHREGFEVKVTEALFKKKPVIAYAAGGIPLQLPLDYPLLLPVCDFRGVADKLFDLFTDDIAYTKFQNIAEKWGRREEYFTVFQAVNWLWLIYRLASGWKRPFNVATTRSVYVKDEWKYWYSERTGKTVTQWGDYIPN
jgi:glycosyltransferase involved in cell wall biosynthesis